MRDLEEYTIRPEVGGDWVFKENYMGRTMVRTVFAPVSLFFSGERGLPLPVCALTQALLNLRSAVRRSSSVGRTRKASRNWPTVMCRQRGSSNAFAGDDVKLLGTRLLARNPEDNFRMRRHPGPNVLSDSSKLG
jgi:hypothetical protein